MFPFEKWVPLIILLLGLLSCNLFEKDPIPPKFEPENRFNNKYSCWTRWYHSGINHDVITLHNECIDGVKNKVSETIHNPKCRSCIIPDTVYLRGKEVYYDGKEFTIFPPCYNKYMGDTLTKVDVYGILECHGRIYQHLRDWAFYKDIVFSPQRPKEPKELN